MKRTLIVPESLESAGLAMMTAGRTDEFLEGAKWVLEREAERGRLVWQDPPVYVLAMEAGADSPRLSLFYTISYDKVVLLSLSGGNRPAGRPGIGPGSPGY
ncbi:MAG: hypothetical protein JWP91_648 [Fibrobacteres bacterium]|nr:hypothetical protein [Fibrobacterota bacterium]